jgi:branched-chain amino acid aminotransferase
MSLLEIDIFPNKFSHIQDVDFDNISFGSIFTDHMLICDFNDNQWHKPIIKKYEPFLMDPSSKVFHYGQAIFEGMKAYNDRKGGIWLFRPDQNHDRFNKSAIRLAMPEIPEDIFIEGLKKLIQLDSAWVKAEDGHSLYLRPFMIATGTGVIANPSNNYRFAVIMSPAKSYFAGEVHVVIAEHYSRAANGGVGAAKAAGNYAAQFYPTNLANQEGYQQVVWTDSTHTHIEEAGTMNIFARIGDKLITAPTSERILDGVTRKSLIDLAKHLNIDVEVRPLLIAEIIEAAKTGDLKELFGAGTAVVVSPIASFAYKNERFVLPKIENSFALLLKSQLTGIQNRILDDPFGWMVKVN